MSKHRHFRKNDSGAAAAEYALVLAILSGAGALAGQWCGLTAHDKKYLAVAMPVATLVLAPGSGSWNWWLTCVLPAGVFALDVLFFVLRKR